VPQADFVRIEAPQGAGILFIISAPRPKFLERMLAPQAKFLEVDEQIKGQQI
jgi:hypothetical protein